MVISSIELAIYCLIPIGTIWLLFCHELGHAVPILLASGQAHITIGSPDGRTVTVSQISVTVGMDGLRYLFMYGDVRWSGVDSKFVQAVGIFGGPLVTVSVIGVISAVLLNGVDGPLFFVLANLLIGESYRLYRTVIPKTYSQGPYERMPSDGRRFQQLIQSRNNSSGS